MHSESSSFHLVCWEFSFFSRLRLEAFYDSYLSVNMVLTLMPTVCRGHSQIVLMLVFSTLNVWADYGWPLIKCLCNSFKCAHLQPPVPVLVRFHTSISPCSLLEHRCELSPSTVVNNWVSYLSCWICAAERASGAPRTNWDQMNHSSGS